MEQLLTQPSLEEGTEDIKITGTTGDFGRLGSSREVLSSGQKKSIRIVVPPATTNGRELKKVNVKYTIPGTAYTARLTLYVYYIPCPIITGVAGMNLLHN
ncbi:MAG: hypothetical protein R2883_00385 [Caldisericia bacterium]